MPKASINISRLLSELCDDLNIDSISRNYALHRLEKEGVRFVTYILPQFSKWCLKCIEAGRLLPRSTMTSIRWKDGVPIFLGYPLAKAIQGDAVALYVIRQFCEYLYKLSFDFSEDKVAEYTEKYISTDCELEDLSFSKDFIDEVRGDLHDIFYDINRISLYDAVKRNRFTSGSFSHVKENIDRIKVDLGSDYPIVSQETYKKLPDFLIGTTSTDFSHFSGYFRPYKTKYNKIKLIREDRIADLRFVPKDSRGPRVISKEPLHHLRMQMGFHDFICPYLTLRSYNRINFINQETNGQLAKASSINRHYATLDLKDASDRVSMSLWTRLSKGIPLLSYFLSNVRSTHVRLPDGRIHRLRKVANMGSGLCFPLLSLTVFLAGIYGVKRALRCKTRYAMNHVYVYGDDLIVPSEAYSHVTEALSRFGLLTNYDKSFVNGFFRESCGSDYFHGISVSPIRLKLTSARLKGTFRNSNSQPYFNISSEFPLGVLQLERHIRLLMEAGLVNTAEYLYCSLEKITGKLPVTNNAEEPSLCRYNPYGLIPLTKTNKSIFVKPKKVVISKVCPYKGISKYLRREKGISTPLFERNLYQDWFSTPLRYQGAFRIQRS